MLASLWWANTTPIGPEPRSTAAMLSPAEFTSRSVRPSVARSRQPVPTAGRVTPGLALATSVGLGFGFGGALSAQPVPTTRTNALTAASSVLARRDIETPAQQRVGDTREDYPVRPTVFRRPAPTAWDTSHPWDLRCTRWVGSRVTADT